MYIWAALPGFRHVIKEKEKKNKSIKYRDGYVGDDMGELEEKIGSVCHHITLHICMKF